MLLYAFGLLFIIFSSASWMLLVGYVIAGLAVGADIPASWTLIAELAPDGARGRHSGVAQVLWYCGPVVVLLLSLAMSSLGVLGIRIVFAHLFLLSSACGRSGVGCGSPTIWAAAERRVRERAERARQGASRAQDAAVTSFGHLRELFHRRNVGAMAVPHRDVRGLEPVGRDERVLLPLHPAHGRLGEPGDERGHAGGSFFLGMVSIYFVFMR